MTNLPAGPELDALVAEALGWKSPSNGYTAWFDPDGLVHGSPKPFSTDLAYCGVMLEWLKGKRTDSTFHIEIDWWPESQSWLISHGADTYSIGELHT